MSAQLRFVLIPEAQDKVIFPPHHGRHAGAAQGLKAQVSYNKRPVTAMTVTVDLPSTSGEHRCAGPELEVDKGLQWQAVEKSNAWNNL